MDEKAGSFEFAFFISLHDGLFCQARSNGALSSLLNHEI